MSVSSTTNPLGNPLGEQFELAEERVENSFSSAERQFFPRASVGSASDLPPVVEHPHQIASLLVICGLAYASLYVMFGDVFLPFKLGWSLLLLLGSLRFSV